MGFLHIFILSYSVFVIACQGYSSYDELYQEGLEAYWNDNWDGAIAYFEAALQSYKANKEGVKECFELCSRSSSSNSYKLSELKYIFEKVDLSNQTKSVTLHCIANCLEKCANEKFGDSRSITGISDEVKNIFQTKVIYKYLQFAYFRGGFYNESVAVTHTYYLFNPEDEMMQQNMKYYMKNPNTTNDMLKNLEAVPHIEEYNLGVDLYESGNYKKAVEYFESALVEFYSAERGCEAVCEADWSEKEYYDNPTPFYNTVIGHYQSVLECKLRCPDEVSRTNMKSFPPNFLPNLYNYLQDAYLKSNLDEQSASCMKSYLLFYVKSDYMNELLEKTQHVFSVPRKEASQFVQRLKLLSESLKYIYDNFGVQDYDKQILDPYFEEFPKNAEKVAFNDDTFKEINTKMEQSKITKDRDNNDHNKNVEEIFAEDSDLIDESVIEYTSSRQKTNDIINSKDQHNLEMERLRKKRESEKENEDVDISWMKIDRIGRTTVDSKFIRLLVDSSSLSSSPEPEGPIIFSDATLLANSSQMAGPMRFAMDGMADEDQCRDLIDLELSAGLDGDGYKGHSSPHTKSELFQGLTVHRAALLAEQGKIPFGIAKTYYDLSEKVLQQVAAYFKLDQLYFDYTHLVCRTAIRSEFGVKELSHPVHGDNCVLYSDGTCIKEHPAYTWRDYSAILYLNHNFEGGEFIMTDDTAKRVMLQVTPKCGRLVSFCAGGDCLHGVKPVTRGRRCAVALWFTEDQSHDEQLRIEAKQILDGLSRKEEL